jgi:hypothetical protein
VMKDGETAQNKGWFGRKKTPVTAPQNVSRPPSASSFTPYKRKSSVPEVGATDDGLPPREESPERTGSPGPPSAPTENSLETQETVDGNGDVVEPAPTVPLHAGFDFAAIKDVLRESKETGGGKVPAVSLNPIPEHMIPSASPITRSGSAPPYTSTHRPPPHSQLSYHFTGDDDGEGRVTDDLAPAFSRSLSLVDAATAGSNNEFTSVDNTLGPEVPKKSPLPSNSPQVSFGSYDGGIWQASYAGVYQSETAASKPSLSLLGEGRENGSGGYLSSSPTIDPFATRSSLSPGGTIGYERSTPIVPPPNHEADPWSSLTRGKKAISGFNANPWA